MFYKEYKKRELLSTAKLFRKILLKIKIRLYGEFLFYFNNYLLIRSNFFYNRYKANINSGFIFF
ncbi:hypothetical protein JW698_00345, partial [Candidatus Wolfebacteria bacterium]|nr:hypothetical protein [Candidatus Wolfebacteria bacterium]